MGSATVCAAVSLGRVPWHPEPGVAATVWRAKRGASLHCQLGPELQTPGWWAGQRGQQGPAWGRNLAPPHLQGHLSKLGSCQPAGVTLTSSGPASRHSLGNQWRRVGGKCFANTRVWLQHGAWATETWRQPGSWPVWHGAFLMLCCCGVWEVRHVTGHFSFLAAGTWPES